MVIKMKINENWNRIEWLSITFQSIIWYAMYTDVSWLLSFGRRFLHHRSKPGRTISV